MLTSIELKIVIEFESITADNKLLVCEVGGRETLQNMCNKDSNCICAIIDDTTTATTTT